MPKYRGITVHVTDRHDTPLKEWSVLKRESSHFTSCFIQSETDMAFRIHIQPELPFEWSETEAAARGQAEGKSGDGVSSSFQRESETREHDGSGEGETQGAGDMFFEDLEGYGNVRDDGPIRYERYTEQVLGAEDGAEGGGINDARGYERSLERILSDDEGGSEGEGFDDASGHEESGEQISDVRGGYEGAGIPPVHVGEWESYSGVQDGTVANAPYGYNSYWQKKLGLPRDEPIRITLKAPSVPTVKKRARPNKRSRRPLNVLEYWDRLHVQDEELQVPPEGTPEELNLVLRLYSDSQDFSRRMEMSDVTGSLLRTHIIDQMKRFPEYNLEDLVLNAALGHFCPMAARKVLKRFAGVNFRGRGLEQLNRRWIPRALLPEPAPWHLLVTLWLDGKKSYEKRRILYLDDRHEHFTEPGDIKMARRNVRDKDGTVRECGWYFKEVGIETMFDKLLLSGGDGDDEAIPLKEDDDLLKAFSQLGENGLEDKEETTQAGQILVTFERITVGEVHKNVYWMADGNEDEAHGMAADDMSKVTHTSALDAGKRSKKQIDTVDYQSLVPGEELFASFRFNYSSEEKLRTFGFPDFPAAAPAAIASTKRRNKRRNKEAFDGTALAPLSTAKTAIKPVEDDHLGQFRKMETATTEGERGDEEASDHGSVVGDELEEDDGVAKDGNDEGAGERLKKVKLGKHGAEDAPEVEESSAAAAKKIKVDKEETELERAKAALLAKLG